MSARNTNGLNICPLSMILDGLPTYKSLGNPCTPSEQMFNPSLAKGDKQAANLLSPKFHYFINRKYFLINQWQDLFRYTCAINFMEDFTIIISSSIWQDLNLREDTLSHVVT